MSLPPRTLALLASRGLACFLVLTCWSAGVRAQPMGEVLVLPFGAPDVAPAISASSMLEAELARTQTSLISLHDARDRFTARSRPPQVASDSDVDVLAREAREVIEHIAFGRTSAAQKSVREVIARAELTLESLNRETATARQILDTCLSMVRGALQSGKRDTALEQATRCRRLVPDLAPSLETHPANVIGVLAEADNLLRRMRIGNLTVLSKPESGCSVYLNGRHLGVTPFQLDRAAAGDYRVQVECGRSIARVHVVQLGDQPTTLRVDTQLDRAVGSDPRLMLSYESPSAAQAQAASHASQLGREVGADDVLLLGFQGDRIELLRVRVAQQRVVGRVTVPWSARHGFPRPALERALLALAEGRFVGSPSVVSSAPSEPTRGPDEDPSDDAQAAPSSPPEARAPTAPAARPLAAEASGPAIAAESEPKTTARPEPSARDRRRAQRRAPRLRLAGYGLAGAATALFALGIGFDLRAQRLDDSIGERLNSFSEGELDRAAAIELEGLQRDYDRAARLRWIGVTGPALATAAVVLLAKPRERLPWWSYAIAGVGVAALAGATYEIATTGECLLEPERETQPCFRQRNSWVRGVLLASVAVPLLSVPLVQRTKRASRWLSLHSSKLPGRGMQLSLRVAY